MKDKIFIDTNILLYLYSEDEKKKKRVLECISCQKSFYISTQVLNEFCQVCIKKLKVPIDIIHEALEDFKGFFSIHEVSIRTIESALIIQFENNLSYFDSLIISSALELECSQLLSEDMNHHQLIRQKLKIVNPFQ